MFIVTRDCCLGPRCSRDHKPNRPLRVEQLRTEDRAQAERCAKNFNTYPYTYNAEVHEIA